MSDSEKNHTRDLLEKIYKECKQIRADNQRYNDYKIEREIELAEQKKSALTLPSMKRAALHDSGKVNRIESVTQYYVIPNARLNQLHPSALMLHDRIILLLAVDFYIYHFYKCYMLVSGRCLVI